MEFVNRTRELELLREQIYPQARKGTISFWRSPRGFGKSRLMDRLVEDFSPEGPTCIVVDPAIRSTESAERIYEWFFVQRAADPAARRRVPGRREFPEFPHFLKRKWWRLIRLRELYDNAKNVDSIYGWIKVGLDLGENVFQIVRGNSGKLLQRDGRLGAEMARSYLEALATHRPILFVVRDAHRIDRESFLYFVGLAESCDWCSVIFEYTCTRDELLPDHQKLLEEAVVEKSSIKIFDLVKLNEKEFHYLLRKYVPVYKDIEVGAEIKWDGNLRIIRELCYTMVLDNGTDAVRGLDHQATLKKNIASLSIAKRLILALVSVHVEALSEAVLKRVLQRIDPSAASSFPTALTELCVDKYLLRLGENISLGSGDLQEAIEDIPSMQSCLKGAATGLRGYYLEVVSTDAFHDIQLEPSLRQAVALCARTGDIFALRELVGKLDFTARHIHNQSLYVRIVADVILGKAELLELEKKELVEWASGAAYEAGDMSTAAQLIETLPSMAPYETALLACCYGEINRHDDAVAHARMLSGPGNSADVVLAGRLIECLNLFASGRKGEAASLHASLRSDTNHHDSSLFGFVLRFSEVVEDFPQCVPDVLKSADALLQHGLKKSASYSRLAGAIHLAYLGRISEAQKLIAQAEIDLRSHLHDSQILHNNACVVEMLSKAPDFTRCIARLKEALFVRGDSFSKLALNNNLLICFWKAGNQINANHCLDVIDRILEAPGFGNQDILITVCFNAWRFCVETMQESRALRYKTQALRIGLDRNCYASYWKVRFGIGGITDPAFDFLLQFDYHPEYLSHWIIDLEGLRLLKEEFSR